ncbi:hypothetical protein GE21DRAFT_9840 [Neurospora crassa]|uniref:SWR1-complex protein 3 domain-containing protein n=1 Tax=Neurospora crassa (strain ATCC 24698 / 74-OR23-1A / CBS 708.71 / DSM 1257 / FGSC 987) TaxID=367110 RepID=Q7S3C5_NEUCR|nr:hypothetical protein NCU06928 [Neurospora crassa OR74A]EAA30039.1 hypothetical protein NCU06928 [Neurospora crassa OR74A]KHE88054.1 hypothetical protein GE21DRAFT_9840 [Neurospora crassa]|eukprot:XP_959275.1 hypothetical protein NCU06928 [Neurospora crassa OR74A]
MTTEKKRKLPPRAAARSEQAAKRRQTDTPPTSRKSSTPAPAPQKEPEPEPTVEEPPKQTLPSSVTAGKPLPTVEEPQPEDLSTKDYQTLQESGVLHESFVRSRNQWMTEQIFEKYWTKPIKKRGAVIEEPNNPPKDSMVKLGQVTITVEPHVFEATMFAVKDPNPPPPKPPTEKRPILEYGPPNGVMPPPPTPKPKSVAASTSSTPTPAASDAKKPTTTEADPKVTSQTTQQAEAKPQTPGKLAVHPTSQTQPTKQPSAQSAPSPAAAAPSTLAKPAGTPRGIESLLSPSPSLAAPRAPTTAPAAGAQPPRPVPVPPTVPPSAATPATPSIPSGVPPRPATGAPAAPAAPATPRTTANGAAPAKPAAGADPIILMLAEKAGEDPQLRDLMKRVAQGEASKQELERFQGIIDAITSESKRQSNIPAPPAADKLFVDGKTVQYFADEVAAILDIVLASNPKQKSSTLQPPKDSDALLVSLVKMALDDEKTKEMVRRIAHNKPQPTDATDLKAILDLAHSNLVTKKTQQQRRQSTVSAAGSSKQTNGASNGTDGGTGTTSQANAAEEKKTTEKAEKATKEKGEKADKSSAQQALRSKGPPPPPKQPDYSAIVFEFAGGNGDRYLFPKFSILDYQTIPSSSASSTQGQQQQQQQQQQVVASFLIIRRGSKAVYPMADPELDYYQPITIRLFTAAPSGKHVLDNLARVVAPEEEVKRYMDDIMDTMQRSEYVLLAMRLPRPTETAENGEGEGDKAQDGAGAAGSGKGQHAKEKDKDKEVVMIDAPSRAEEAAAAELKAPKAARTGGVLWTTANKQIPKPEIRELPPRRNARIMMETAEDEQYQSFIQTVTRKDKEVVR